MKRKQRKSKNPNFRGNTQTFEFMCTECVVVFQINSPVKNSTRKYCPNCGDYIAVKSMFSLIDQPQKPPRDINWSDEEIADLDRCIKGEILNYQMAVKWGRTSKAIYRRKSRRIQELKELAEKENTQNG